MKRKKSFLCTGLALTLSALVAACAPAALVAKVTFVEPKNGATVSSPVTVKMAAENFTVEPAGEVKAGAGHLHITGRSTWPWATCTAARSAWTTLSPSIAWQPRPHPEAHRQPTAWAGPICAPEHWIRPRL